MLAEQVEILYGPVGTLLVVEPWTSCLGFICLCLCVNFPILFSEIKKQRPYWLCQSRSRWLFRSQSPHGRPFRQTKRREWFNVQALWCKYCLLSLPFCVDPSFYVDVHCRRLTRKNTEAVIARILTPHLSSPLTQKKNIKKLMRSLIIWCEIIKS